jgi:hypothetical protein
MAQQSSREFASTDPTTRTQDAGLQEHRVSTKFLSFPFMQQSTTRSTSNAISPQQERTEPSAHRPCRRGVKSSLRREPDVRGDLLRARFVNVTEPAGEPKSRLPFAFLSFTPGHAIGELDAGADFADCRFPTRC